ncbi:hypothetical protein R0137_09795 [Congregibacter brevis]|uniref:DUF4760 domain-containing protein n=1 Tax=Congregibacter brevis TaxID=3081201 RepID=A0ABZ0I8A1_9GAMM|nr:hypothetical protein R0137_09795 [Congregibacter sp. IMCC45268]
MNWEAVGAIGEVAGGIVVIVTILYLARQIRENSRIAKAESQRALLETAQIWAPIATTPGLVTELRKAVQSYESLDPDSQGRFTFMLYPLINRVESAYRMHQQGMIDEDAYLGWMYALAAFLREPGLSAWWSDLKQVIGPEFIAALDEILLDEEVPPLSSAWKFLGRES